jgi:hypothetical protein
MKAELVTPDGEIIEANMEQFRINHTQVACLIDCDVKILAKGTIQTAEGWTIEHIGNIRELPYIFEVQLRNSLIYAGWDFEKCLNPEVLMINKVR